ncbi:MAG TPA: D-glycero-beta-D-manno-heptose 1,7-bisphosphate 7-phosphatase [Candidatus Omnitrophota bacterium]|nr:D-glycero-beta-D-manno-heptose 1,7-bisphosphate 7-phosphatase [Candidatus Omnitrophota bacterium]
MNRAVFLDKDGTINEDPGYVSHYRDVKILPHSAEAIKLLNEAGYKVIVITNQAGVARGYFGEDMLQAINKTMQKHLLSKGAYIDDIYYCPHHKEHGHYPYRRECECRKPGTALFKKAAKRHDIDLSRSFMVGDHSGDIEGGNKAGAKTVLVLTGHEKISDMKVKPDHVADNLLEAAKWILKN